MKAKHQHDPGCIRRDIYSVKVYDQSAEGWCHQHMAMSPETARHLARDAKHEASTLGRIPMVKIVHPRQEVVEAFLAFGNTIRK